MQTRSTSSRPALAGDGRTVTVRALTYGVPDTYSTSWAPGVFADHLRSGATVPVCWGHDHKRVVGRVVGHEERNDGLYLTIRLADPADVPDARMVRSLLREGAIRGVSVGFKDAQGRPDPNNRGVTQFTRARLREVSFVVDASVPGAEVLGVRGAAVDYELDEEEMRLVDALLAEDELNRQAEAAVAKLDLLLLGRGITRSEGRSAVAVQRLQAEREAEQQAERERLRRQLYAHDTMPPDPHAVEAYFGATSWTVKDPARDPEYLAQRAGPQPPWPWDNVAPPPGYAFGGQTTWTIPRPPVGDPYPTSAEIEGRPEGMSVEEAVHRWRQVRGFE